LRFTTFWTIVGYGWDVERPHGVVTEARARPNFVVRLKANGRFDHKLLQPQSENETHSQVASVPCVRAATLLRSHSHPLVTPCRSAGSGGFSLDR